MRDPSSPQVAPSFKTDESDDMISKSSSLYLELTYSAVITHQGTPYASSDQTHRKNIICPGRCGCWIHSYFSALCINTRAWKTGDGSKCSENFTKRVDTTNAIIKTWKPCIFPDLARAEKTRCSTVLHLSHVVCRPKHVPDTSLDLRSIPLLELYLLLRRRTVHLRYARSRVVVDHCAPAEGEKDPLCPRQPYCQVRARTSRARIKYDGNFHLSVELVKMRFCIPCTSTSVQARVRIARLYWTRNRNHILPGFSDARASHITILQVHYLNVRRRDK